MHRIQPKLFASLLLCVLAGTIGCAARDEADCPMPDREMRIGYGLGYAVRAEVIDGKTQAGEIKVFDYMSEKTWSRRVTYSDDNDYRGDIQRVACFQGKDNARPIVVVAFCGYSWGNGALYAAYHTLSVFELDINAQTMRLVWDEPDAGESGYLHSEDAPGCSQYNTFAFFDVEVHFGQVFFLLFKRTAPDKIAQVEKFVLKDEGFVPVEATPSK